jgi:hypothetical protein
MPYEPFITTLLRPFTRDLPPSSDAWSERRYQYRVYEAYYHNHIYERLAEGGFRDQINAALGEHAARDLAGLYNPVGRAVDLYRHTLAGDFGDDITLDPQRSNMALLDPLQHIWRWSNINQWKRLATEYAANLGTAGLRIVASNPVQGEKKVFLKLEHPSLIVDVADNGRGDVSGIVLQYEQRTGLGDAADTVTIREEQTKAQIVLYRVDTGGKLTEINRYDNDLGVVSYVLLWHKPTGTPFGANCYYRQRGALDRLNALLTHIDLQIHDHVNATWIVAGQGKPPERFTVGGREIIYFNTANGSAPPDVQAMVANLSLADAIARAKQQQDWIADELPELKATSGQFLSGQSGETVAELRKPAEDALRDARDNLEDGLIRAQKIALSWGVLMNLWDLGTGTGTREAADRAFQSGREDHRFNKRPLLTLSEPAQLALDTQRTNVQRSREALERDRQATTFAQEVAEL